MLNLGTGRSVRDNIQSSSRGANISFNVNIWTDCTGIVSGNRLTSLCFESDIVSSDNGLAVFLPFVFLVFGEKWSIGTSSKLLSRSNFPSSTACTCVSDLSISLMLSSPPHSSSRSPNSLFKRSNALTASRAISVSSGDT